MWHISSSLVKFSRPSLHQSVPPTPPPPPPLPLPPPLQEAHEGQRQQAGMAGGGGGGVEGVTLGENIWGFLAPRWRISARKGSPCPLRWICGRIAAGYRCASRSFQIWSSGIWKGKKQNKKVYSASILLINTTELCVYCNDFTGMASHELHSMTLYWRD